MSPDEERPCTSAIGTGRRPLAGGSASSSLAWFGCAPVLNFFLCFMLMLDALVFLVFHLWIERLSTVSRDGLLKNTFLLMLMLAIMFLCLF